MKNYLELSKNELMHIEGGMNIFKRIGYAIGATAANTIDFIDGVIDGINEAFDEETE